MSNRPLCYQNRNKTQAWKSIQETIPIRNQSVEHVKAHNKVNSKIQGQYELFDRYYVTEFMKFISEDSPVTAFQYFSNTAGLALGYSPIILLASATFSFPWIVFRTFYHRRLVIFFPFTITISILLAVK